MVDNLGSGTAKGLVDYLDSLVSKGRAPLGAVGPLKTALIKVVETTEGDEWGNIDVIKFDVNDTMSRFKNLTLGKYTEGSYKTYGLRIKRAISWYENFLQNPGWFPKENVRVPKAQNGNNKVASEKTGTDHDSGVKPTSSIQQSPSTSHATETPRIDAIAYPFPLSNGETARIYMPKGITKPDVRRLSAFLEALVIEDSEE